MNTKSPRDLRPLTEQDECWGLRRLETDLPDAAHSGLLGAFHIYIDPSEPDRLVPLTYAALIVYVIYSLVLYLLTVLQPGLRGFRSWAPWMDIAWYVGLIALSSGTNSVFFFSLPSWLRLSPGGSNRVYGLLTGLNLRDASGSNFDPATYAHFRNWILSANATNMANTLSAQMAAMQLNVRQENLKNALDRANNNLNFVQAQPCPFSFSE